MNEFDFEERAKPSVLTLGQIFVYGGLYWKSVALIFGALLMGLWDGSGVQLNLGTGLALFVVGWAALWVWRFMGRGKFRAGFTSGVLAICSPVVLIIAIAAWGEAETSSLEGGEEVDESHLVFGVASASKSGEGREGFDVCIEELHRKPVEGESMRDEALKALRRTVGPDLARDAVQDVMIAVCEKFEAGRVEVLRPYFFRAVQNQRRDLGRVKSRWEYCEFDEGQFRGRRGRQEDVLELRQVQAAMCRLDDRKAYAIRRKADGDSHAEIARELGISQAQSRRFVSDGRAELRQLLEGVGGR